MRGCWGPSQDRPGGRGGAGGAAVGLRPHGLWGRAWTGRSGQDPAAPSGLAERSAETCQRGDGFPRLSPQMYNFTSFTVSLNELQSGMEKTLAPTDCRLRPDIRGMENGDMGALAGRWGRGAPVLQVDRQGD